MKIGLKKNLFPIKLNIKKINLNGIKGKKVKVVIILIDHLKAIINKHMNNDEIFYKPNLKIF